ncbi:MAG: hypothetical protein UU53_C0014G0007 [Candidatus Curtissbacteria bacterium GW2011_GWC2_41_21]|nr:MAG: hypothetical protein UU53_C0014G0007 [Candidatus Curtissbacteria bacterium GW2011_GWC2_41_21]
MKRILLAIEVERKGIGRERKSLEVGKSKVVEAEAKAKTAKNVTNLSLFLVKITQSAKIKGVIPTNRIPS